MVPWDRAFSAVSKCVWLLWLQIQGSQVRPPHPQSHTFMEIDHEIISMANYLPSTDTRRVVASYKRKYVHEVVNRLVKLAQEKSVVR